MNTTIRIGIVGAGANTRLRHIPGFRAIEGVELAGVVGRELILRDVATNSGEGAPKNCKKSVFSGAN